jgi:hypothetical protein
MNARPDFPVPGQLGCRMIFICRLKTPEWFNFLIELPDAGETQPASDAAVKAL